MTATSADATIAEAQGAGVARMVTIGTDSVTSAQGLVLAGRHPGVVWATVGLHPHDADQGLDQIVDLAAEHAASPAVVAIGECGLDYHYDHSPRAVQREVFAAQVALARETGLALVIHARDAWHDVFDILDAEGVPESTVLHCFTGGPEQARGCLDRGLHLSFSGIVTFRNASEVREAAALCPDDRLLVETDSPYLAPVPHRGKANRPALLPLVGEGVAAARGVPTELVAEVTWDNAARVYGLG